MRGQGRLGSSAFARPPLRFGAVTNGLAFAGLSFGIFSAVYDLTFVSYFIAKSIVEGGALGALMGEVDRVFHSFSEVLRDLSRFVVFRLADFGIVVPDELYRYVTPAILVLIRLPQMILDFLLFIFLHRTLDDIDREIAGAGGPERGGVDVASWTAAFVAVGGGVAGAVWAEPVWLVVGVVIGAVVGAILGQLASGGGVRDDGAPARPQSHKTVRLQNRRRRFAASRNIAVIAAVAAAILAPVHAFVDTRFEQRTGSDGPGCQKVDRGLFGEVAGLETIPAGAVVKGANERCECTAKNGVDGPVGYTTRTKDYQRTRTEVLIICRILPGAETPAD